MKKIIKALMMVLLAFSTVVLASCEFQFVLPQPTTPTDSEKTEPTQTTEPGTDVVTNPTVPAESVIQKILEEAATLEDKGKLDGERTATGTVKEITDPYTDQYKNITFVLTDGVADILVFRAKGDCAATLKVGDTVTATGEVINYGGTIEFQYAALTTTSQGGNEEDENLPTIKSILEEAASLGDGETLSGNRKTVGTVKEITDAYSSQYKNISFTLEDATGTIKVFRAKGNCAASLQVGDKVYVEGEVINYGGTIEFQYAALTTGTEQDEDQTNKPVELSTVKAVLDAAAKLGEGAALPNQYKVTGTVSGFESKFSYGSGDYYIFYVTDETGTIYVFSPVGDALETLKNGDTVYVKGTVKNYKGTIEFDSAKVSFADDFDLTNVQKLTEEEKTPIIPTEVSGDYDFISLPMAIAIAKDGGEDFVSTETYYITGWVSDVSNPAYGSITITDGNVKIYAYGISNYLSESEWPLLGDVVVLKAVLGTIGSDVELKNSTTLVEWHDIEVEESEYTVSTIAEARSAEAGSKVIVEGVVAGFTYKNAKDKNGNYVADGLYLVNGTDSIYLYGPSICSVASVGNKIKVAGIKEYFIQESEIELAAKFGFTGACQLSNVELISNDNGNTEFKNNSFEETTIKELMENEYDENVTTQIFKVNTLIRKSQGSGFVNYYLNDLDGTTGSYTYTKCNGNDFAWIEDKLNANGEYLCTVLMTVCNAKATSSGCVWRFVPVAILGDYSFDLNDTTDHVLDYYALPQFGVTYYANPAKELVTSVSSKLLGFENATIEYVSDNTEVATISVVEDKTVLNVIAVGEANLTITVTYNGKTSVQKVKVVREAEPTFETITVAEAVESEKGTTVVVEGIVGPSLINQTGFYLVDETGVIALKMTNDELAKFEQGNRVVITGTRNQNRPTSTLPGQSMIEDVELVHNYFGSHEYSTASFKESTLAAISQYPATVDWTTQVFIIEASVFSQGYNNYIQNGQDSIGIYCSGANQNAWLVEATNGEVVKMEVALCNWNEKSTYKCCVLAVYKADGTKVVNPYNFSK